MSAPPARVGAGLTEPDHHGFLRMLDVLVPTGGHILAQVEAYFDESVSYSKSQTLCLAGYLFERQQAVLLSEKWSLALKAYGLPFFHMVECAHGKSGLYADMTTNERIQLQTKMIELIKQFSICGIAVSVHGRAAARIPWHQDIGGPYAFAAHAVLWAIEMFIEEHPNVREMSYFFEAGNSGQGEANNLIQRVFSIKGYKELFRYAGHAFVPKEKSPPVQAADLLA
jgi:hypothetical protein